MTIAKMWKQCNPQSISGWMDKQNVCTEQWNLLSLRRKEILTHATTWGFPGGSLIKNLPASAGNARDSSSSPRLGGSPGEFHGQRSLVGYSPWVHKESDTTEHTCMLQHK